MNNVIKRGFVWSTVAFSALLMFTSESAFCHHSWSLSDFLSSFSLINCLLTAEDINIIISKLLYFFAVLVFCELISLVVFFFRRRKKIKIGNSIIQVEYGDIMKVENCMRVINFDECFTTKVGAEKGDIRPTSICGQYLHSKQNIDMQSLIACSQIVPEKTKSLFRNQIRYKPGSIVPNGKDLLLAFARLDKDGRGMFYSIDDFRDCLSTMWDEIDKYNQQCDVCIPVLGSGLARLDYSQQELLDMIIGSYKMTSHKIMHPHKLRIICMSRKDISLENV